MVEFEWLFNPRSVAVVGASNSPAKVGMMTLLSIIAGKFKGKIYPINPKEGEILGLKAYSSVKEVRDRIDLAIICVSAPLVLKVIEECAEAEVKFGVVLSSGFGEASEEGKGIEKEMVRIARERGMRIIGPNCMGISSSASSLYALMNMLIPMAGSVSVVSQSGTLGSLAMVDVSDQSVGFSKFISSGNEADLHMEDFIEYFANDPETKVIFAFIEGVRNGRKFFRVAKKATKNKPFIVIKGGTTEFGAKAASSHTGAIAGSTTAYDVAFKQTGITKAVDERDVINLIKAFSLLPLPKGRKVGIVSGWGGKGVLASDACAKEGLEILELREEAIEKLNQFLPPFWSHRNPIDLTGAGLFGDFSALLSKSIEVLLDDKNIDAVIFTIPSFKSVFESVLPRMDPNISPALSGTSMGFLAKSEEKIAKDIIGLKKKYQKPIVGIAIGLSRQKGSKGVKFLENNGAPVYETPSEAARVLSKMLDYRRYVERLKEAKI